MNLSKFFEMLVDVNKAGRKTGLKGATPNKISDILKSGYIKPDAKMKDIKDMFHTGEFPRDKSFLDDLLNGKKKMDPDTGALGPGLSSKSYMRKMREARKNAL